MAECVCVCVRVYTEIIEILLLVELFLRYPFYIGGHMFNIFGCICHFFWQSWPVLFLLDFFSALNLINSLGKNSFFLNISLCIIYLYILLVYHSL